MNLKRIVIVFNVLLGINAFIIIAISNSYAVLFPILSMAGIGLSYLVFWFVGNNQFWRSYNEKDRKLVGFFLNLPMAIALIIGFIAWANYQLS